jgi:anti-anti-sigma factor
MCSPLPRHHRRDRAAVVDGGDVLVHVAGEVDAATTPRRRPSCIAPGTASVVTSGSDLGAVTFLDSAALSVLLRARGWLTDRGRRLVVTDPGRAAQRVFELTGLLGTLQPEADPGRD